MIQNSYRIPVSQQTLSFNGVIMADELRADHYGLSDGSRLLLHLHLLIPDPETLHDINPDRTPFAPFPVTFRFPLHRIRLFAVYIDGSSAVSTHLKERLRRHFEICTRKRFPPSWTMSLFHNGVEMNEGRCLVEYGVRIWSVIEVRPATAGESNVWEMMKVAVALPLLSETESPAGTSTVILDVEIYADDVVSQLWIELQLVTRQWPATMVFFFVFKQVVMKDDRTFRWHGVKSGDLIQIISVTNNQ